MIIYQLIMENQNIGKKDIQGIIIYYIIIKYRRPEPFDWYQVYSGFKDIISSSLSKTDKIINIGCGNSLLSEELYEDGYEDITNIDFSSKVINQIEEKNKAKYPKMSFKVMDVLNMQEIQTGSFNVALDKGTLDSVLCGDNSGTNVQKMLNEIHRILSPGGKYICITYGDPEHRKKYFENQQWNNLSVDKILKPNTNNEDNNEMNAKNFHYIYIMKK